MTRMLGVLVIIVASVVACAASPIPTEQEARDFLDRVVAAAKAGDVTTLCEVSNCSTQDRTNPVDPPIDPPTVVSTRVIPTTPIPGGGEQLGGQVLVLCGLGIDSAPYRFEMLVFRANGQLHTPTFKYWQTMGVSGGVSPTTPPGPPEPVNCPAA